MKESYNYTAAFIDFSKGSCLEDVARAHRIPLDTLKSKATHDRWAGLCEIAVADTAALVPIDTRWAMSKLSANRKIAFEDADLLRKRSIEMLNSAGLTAKSLAGIARGLATAQELMYRALGDVEKAAPSGNPNQEPRPPQALVALNIPSLFQSPRQVTQVIDIDKREDNSVENTDKKS